MSELKVYRDPKEGPCYREFYEKSEADKVIAEKDKKIIQLKAFIENYNRISKEIIDNANHQKRKRCLALAQKYLWKRNYWRDSTPAYERQFVWENRAYKHYKRWRELAERFEEVE